MDTIKYLDRSFKGLARLMQEFNIDFDDAIKTLRKHYVLESYKDNKTITRTALKTGIDRRTVSAIIKNKPQYKKNSSIFTIINNIKRQCEQQETKTLNKTGDNSLESIIKKVAYGATTINSVVKELAALGCIKDLGDEIEYITNTITNTPNSHQTMQIYSNHIYRYTNTVLWNVNCQQRSQRDYEYSVFTTRIAPESLHSLHDTTRMILDQTKNQLKKEFEKYYEDVESGTYEEYGISLTQFNLNHKKEENK